MKLISYFLLLVTLGMKLVMAEILVFDKQQLSINGISLQAEVAVTDEQRQQGLMYRHELVKGNGMLFVMDEDSQPCFWMKNTSIPLSLAYINRDYRIVQIEKLQPNDTSFICANQLIKYALEVPQGWFNERGIKVGMTVKGIDHSIP